MKKDKFSIRSYAWSILVMFLIIGWFYPIVGLAALICMAAPIVVAVIRGNRCWCAKYCPRGVFNDKILSLISLKVKPPAFLKSTWFKVIFLAVLMANMVLGLINSATIAEAGMVFVRLVSVTTAITIVLGAIFHQRTWCMFCPMGYLATVTIKAKKKVRL